jgi:hypothetical protein
MIHTPMKEKEMSNEFGYREMKLRASNNNVWAEAAATFAFSLLVGAFMFMAAELVWGCYELAMLFA